MPDLQLKSPLQYVKGVGPKKAEVLAQYGLKTVRDALDFFPRKYLDRTNVVPIDSLQLNDQVTVIGEVKAHGILYGGRKRRYEVILADDTGNIMLLWFAGIRYWERYFKKGMRLAATGRVNFFQGLQIVHPDLERLDDYSDKMVHAGRIIPVYPQTSELAKAGLSSKGLRQILAFVHEHLSEPVEDPVPVPVRDEFGLVDLDTALKNTHFPESREQLEVCRRRLAFDEFLKLQFAVYRNKGRKASTTKKHNYEKPGEKLTSFTRELPFELTSDQKTAFKEMLADLGKPQPMTRMLHGEVGSGKTVVAVMAAVHAAENGLQVAFMAPTEILAEQHFRTWGLRLEELGFKAGILTSQIPAAERRKIGAACTAGEIDVIFGTHALIYDYVQFERLGLVIIDEQHRFGVDQRGRLYAKGDDPDLLVMTATPIPRTLALTLYGDLDLSTIRTLPSGRKPIRTVWRTAEVRDKVLGYLKDEIESGGQAYIVYPLIETTDNLQLENVEDAYKALTESALKGLRVGMVHGRVKPDKRDKTLKAFREGELDVLLATTVIEVGIDNPNASLLIIEHAERFGLAQLHQLRGRIGRGERKSTCVALAAPPISEIAQKRLDYFAANGDGFEIAEADLKLRGPGEIFGVRQSGLPELRVGSLWHDRDLLEASRALVEKLFDPTALVDKAYKKLYSSLETQTANSDAHMGGG